MDLLSQSKYIKDLLQKSYMVDVNQMPTTMLDTYKLRKHCYDIFSKPHQYRSVDGALQYVTLTVLNISHSVNKTC